MSRRSAQLFYCTALAPPWFARYHRVHTLAIEQSFNRRRRPMATQETQVPSIIGAAVPRVDGPLKTSGTAMYSSDYHFPGMVYLVPVPSAIAKGKITRLDASVAEKMPGVLRVMYHGHAPVMYRQVPGDQNAIVDESRPPFEDE